VLPVIATAAAHLPCLADLGYEGEATTLRIPIKQPAVAGSPMTRRPST